MSCQKIRRLTVSIVILLLPFALTLLLQASPAGAQSYNAMAEKQARLDKATAAKQVVDEDIGVVSSQLEAMKAKREELAASKAYLEKLQLRMKGIQLWNALVGVIGVTNDALSKVNPGSSLVVAAAGFIQDRASGELADQKTYMQAKIKRFSDSALSMSEKLQTLQKTIQMEPKEVAQKLVDEGAVQLVPTPLIRMPFTSPLDSVDAVAESAAVVTGKIRYIQEAVKPALSEINQFLTDLDELIQRDKQRQLGEEVHDWGRQVEMENSVRQDKELSDAKAQAAKASAAFSSAPKGGTNLAYSPMDRGSILSSLSKCYDQVKASGRNGYDEKFMGQAYQEYQKVRERILAEAQKKYDADMKTLGKWKEGIDNRYRQLIDGTTDNQRRSALAEEWNNIIQRDYYKTRDNYWAAYSADKNSLEAEEKLIVAEADKRATTMSNAIEQAMASLQGKLSASIESLTGDLRRLQEARAAKVQKPLWDYFPSFYAVDQAGRYDVLTSDRPGAFQNQYSGTYTELENYKPAMDAGLTALRDLSKKEDETFKKIEDAVDVAWSQYQGIAPDVLSLKDRPQGWDSTNPNRFHYGGRIRFYVNGFSFGRAEVKGRYFDVSLPPKTILFDLEALEKFAETYNRQMPVMEKLMADDYRASAIANLAPQVIDALNDFSFRGDWDNERETAIKRFQQKDKAALPVNLSIDDSDGVRFLQDMKAAWEMAKKRVEELQKLLSTGYYKLVYHQKRPSDYAPIIAAIAKIPEKITLYEEVYAMMKKSGAGGGPDLAAIREFYNLFKQAYESRREDKVMSFISDDWEAGDGTTLADLQENIGRSFRVFDQIRYNMQNLKIEKEQEGTYRVSYEVTITSRMFEKNIKHEEKSTVNEEVVLDKSGKVKVVRTLSGRFWYVE
jgi:hypothetical protein